MGIAEFRYQRRSGSKSSIDPKSSDKDKKIYNFIAGNDLGDSRKTDEKEFEKKIVELSKGKIKPNDIDKSSLREAVKKFRSGRDFSIKLRS